MKLQANNYKVENDGIWVSRQELESWRDHYKKVAESLRHLQTVMLYTGKSDVLTDLIKHIKNEKED